MSSPLLRAVKLPIIHTLSRGWLDRTGSSDLYKYSILRTKLKNIFQHINSSIIYNVGPVSPTKSLNELIPMLKCSTILKIQHYSKIHPSTLPLKYNRHEYEKVKLGRKLSCNKLLSGSLAICYAS